METQHDTSIPMLYTRGSYYEVGYQTGSTFKERIQQFFEKSNRVQTKLLKFYEFQSGRDIYELYLKKVKIQFPYYIDEVRGIADGSQMPFEKIFLYNMSKEVYDIHLDKIIEQDTSGCTTVLVNQKNLKIMAHNEDCDPAVSKFGYIIQAEISDKKYEERHESFTAFTYAGALPGTTFGFNNSGMIFSINALRPKEIAEGFTPRIFLTRALMSAKDINQAVLLLENEGYGTACGFCVNIASLQNPETMWNIEVAPGQNKSQIMVYEIKEQKRHYVHSNLYQHMSIENRGGSHSSVARKERANEFPPPQNLHDIKEILGDTSNVKYPIYRLANEYDSSQTASTAVFDICKKNLEVYVGNVKKDCKPLVILPVGR